MKSVAAMSRTAEAQLCQVCTEIDFVEYFRRPIGSRVDYRGYVGPAPDALSLGLFKDICARSSTCSFCCLVVHAVYTKFWDEIVMPKDVLKRTKDMEFRMYSHCYADNDPSKANSQKSCRIGLGSRVADDTFHPAFDHQGEIQLLAQDAVPLFGSELFYGRTLHHEKVDIGLVRDWISRCENNHGNLCLSPLFSENPNSTGPQDLLAIDITRRCICHLPEGARYVALSYVWPVGDVFTLRKANCAQLFQPGSIASFLKSFPLVYQGTINFVSELGEPYLWIDALCIIQDDEEHERFQLSQMDRVFGSAIVTIASAITTMDPMDANAGLPSYRKIRESRQQKVSLIRGLHLLVPNEPLVSLLLRCRWRMRGWTYEECLCSNRILFFTDVQVYFQCSSGVFCEDSIGEGVSSSCRITPRCNLWNPGTHGSDAASRESLRLKARYQSLWEFSNFFEFYLQEYTLRELSYVSDKLNAFLGIQNVLERAIKTKFWNGLPEVIINYALLWTPTNLGNISQGPLIRIDQFPSWSWAGWSWRAELGTFFTAIGLKPEVSWYLINRRGEAIRVEAKDLNETVKFPQEGNQDVDLRNPIRNVLPIDIKMRRDVDVNGLNWKETQFLATWTLIARFQLNASRIILDDRNGMWPESINLTISNDRKNWVGSIIMDERWVREHLLKPQHFDFILMSRSERNLNRGEEAKIFDENVLTKRLWCVLNVMMIQWKGKHAERLGVGVIHEDAWVYQNPKPTFVMLG